MIENSCVAKLPTFKQLSICQHNVQNNISNFPFIFSVWSTTPTLTTELHNLKTTWQPSELHTPPQQAVIYGHSMYIFGGWDGHDTLQARVMNTRSLGDSWSRSFVLNEMYRSEGYSWIFVNLMCHCSVMLCQFQWGSTDVPPQRYDCKLTEMHRNASWKRGSGRWRTVVGSCRCLLVYFHPAWVRGLFWCATWTAWKQHECLGVFLEVNNIAHLSSKIVTATPTMLSDFFLKQELFEYNISSNMWIQPPGVFICWVGGGGHL